MNRIPDSSAIPLQVYDCVQIQPNQREYTIGFTGHPGTSTGELFDLDEHAITDRALEHEGIVGFILEQLDLRRREAWCLIRTNRERFLPSTLQDHAPGGFDLIFGRSKDGLIQFDYLAEVEVKVRKVEADGSPKSFASGLGTSQARKVCDLGFDRVLHLHFLVREGRDLFPDSAPSWEPFITAISTERCAPRRT